MLIAVLVISSQGFCLVFFASGHWTKGGLCDASKRVAQGLRDGPKSSAYGR